MKRIISLILIIATLFTFSGCNLKKPTSESAGESASQSTLKLSTPTGVTCSSEGLITWTAVDNATGYILTINGSEYQVTATSYQVSSIVNDFTYSVVATADGYENSAPTQTYTFTGTGVEIPQPSENLEVAISGATQVKSGKTITLKATVKNHNIEDTVTWEIIQGEEYATIDQNGVITAVEVDEDRKVVVQATSVENPDKKATKTVTVLAKPELTQDMLGVISNPIISFEGYVTINLYTLGLFEKFYTSYDTTIKTAMNGENWYAEYEGATGESTGIYYKKNNGIACQVGVNFLNEEEYFPMEDVYGDPISWQDAGLYNSLVNLSVDDFALNEETWRFDYVGSDANFVQKVISSANPYDFVPLGLSLMVEDGEIVGIYSMAADDYNIVDNYKAVQELFAFINVGDSVEVPTINKYPHFDEHDALTQAIENMKALDSYTLNFYQYTSTMGSAYVEEGFVETVTEDLCYFQPYNVRSYDQDGYPIPSFIENAEYGYHKKADNLYNSFYKDREGAYYAARAFDTSFDHAKASFAFSAEIFTSYYEDPETGALTYYLGESIMFPACSTFYYGVGNDINLYGIFASDYMTGITPWVTVQDGYIVEAVFSFFLGSIYGSVMITYSDFNTATLPEGVEVDFPTRNPPTSWNELTIIKTGEGTSTDDDVEVNAMEYLTEFFGSEQIASEMPFFGIPLGDTYGFAMEAMKITSTNQAKRAIQFYYDVPLDVDYTINESLEKVRDYLESIGFEVNAAGEYRKGNIVVSPEDRDLDLMIYVWQF